VQGIKTADDPIAQLLCAETTNALEEMTATLRRNFEAMTRYAENGDLPPMPERMKYRFQIAYSVERSSLLAARLFKASGSAAIFNRLAFARMLANINAGRQHVACQWEGIGRNWGTAMLGGAPAFDPML
jgi:3-hydroxy-9,10-secoandrosta-1,3,5(10)-triene-9,17-dione monooxygenase